MSKCLQTENGSYTLEYHPITEIEDICKFLVSQVHFNRVRGINCNALFIADEELKQRLCSHLNVSEKPKKDFQARLFNALMEKYGEKV